MKLKIDYAVYIDRKHAFVIALDHMQNERFIAEETVDNPGTAAPTTHVSQQEHVQNKAGGNLLKLCKLIAARLDHVNQLIVFGPSQSKHALQNELTREPRLRDIAIEVVAADVMDKDAALRFAKSHFSSAAHSVK